MSFEWIESDHCDIEISVEPEKGKVFLIVREDGGCDGKVGALTVLNREEAIKLRSYLNYFIKETE